MQEVLKITLDEARANAKVRTADEHEAFVEAYKTYWRLK